MSLLDLNVDGIVRLHRAAQPFTSELQTRRLEHHEVEARVSEVIAACPHSTAAHWDLFLRHELVHVASNEGNAGRSNTTAYYDALCNMLDFILTASEHGVCDDSEAWSALEDLLRVQTVESCSHIFSWIESRAARLTTNLDPRKTKGLTLLRTLNELLGRLSKTGGTTTFCGRILIFLSSVFELGERSGVNLRGDYGPEWEPIKPARTTPLDELSEEARQVEERKEDFFLEFWSFQTPFSRPHKLSMPDAFPLFQQGVNRVLLKLAEATSRERALMGSKAQNGTSAAVAAGTKRKRDDASDKDPSERKEYFFAKYLTSPELLELVIADPQFRRQFFFQLLILLQHLMNFDVKKQAENKKLIPSLQLGGFTLDEAGMTWARETWKKIIDELRSISPNGRQYAEVIVAILAREQNWIKWKNSGCPSFDKPPAPPSFAKTARAKRRKLLEPPPPLEWSHGSEGLSQMWDRGYDEIERAMEEDDQVPSLKSFAKQISKINNLVERRQLMADKMKQPGDAKRPTIVDPIIKSKSEERVKDTWLALRVARTHHFHVLGTAVEDEKDKDNKDKKKKQPNPIKISEPRLIELLADAVDAEEKRRVAAAAKGRDKVSPVEGGEDDKAEGGGDVKMEESEAKPADVALREEGEQVKMEKADELPMDQDPPAPALVPAPAA